MSIFRPSQMDSWNIFSRKFWTVGNLFGKSKREQLKNAAQIRTQAEQRFVEIKITRVNEAHNAIIQLNLFDDNAPVCLTDPITMDLIENPVITPCGGVYDRDSLTNCINRGFRDPLTNTALKMSDIKAFPEFKEKVDQYKTKKAAFDLEMAARIAKATLAANNKTKAAERTLGDIKRVKQNVSVVPSVASANQSWGSYFKATAKSIFTYAFFAKKKIEMPNEGARVEFNIMRDHYMNGL
ncbi:MAG: hypothetical protein NTZ67_05970 [Gammaproteobacteria bacterium]|nr:hypothetical protein [Gammaproteobacteria bacterium]